MDWLSKLKIIQETPQDEVPKVSKSTPPDDDIFKQANDTPKPAEKIIELPQPEPYQQFEQEGDPVSCRFWNQVCYAVGIYQEQCSRDTTCQIYGFLMINTVYRTGQ